MRSLKLLLLLQLCIFLFHIKVTSAADDDAGDDYGDDYADDYNVVVYEDDYMNEADYIQYFTTYALLPKRCIVYNEVDVIVYQMFKNGYKQCSDTPMGTYITNAATFVSAYLEQKELEYADTGVDDYVEPAAAGFMYCTEVEVNDQQYYAMLGCDSNSTQKIGVNLYYDDACTERANMEYTAAAEDDDAQQLDMSGIQLPFKQCHSCVVWMDRDDDDNIDDQYYEKRQRYPPLCQQVWKQKSECDKTCQKTGLEPTAREGWNKSDKVLLGILTMFGVGMLAGILRQRRTMSNKEALLEQAAMTAVGLNQTHIIFIFILTIVVIIIFASLCMKDITWTMLLAMNVILFAYLLKLTVDSGNSCIMNADGTIRRIDSDESSYTSATSKRSQNKFVPPTSTEAPPATATESGTTSNVPNPVASEGNTLV